MTSRPVLIAIVAFVLLAGSNAAAVKVVLGELAPLWSAGLRFVVAGALLLGLMLVQRRPVPRGDHLRGTLIYGVIAFGLERRGPRTARANARAADTFEEIRAIRHW